MLVVDGETVSLGQVQSIVRHRRTPTTPTDSDRPPRPPPPDHHHPNQENHHASFALRRHQRPARQPDHARRDRQQHRQRQHRRLQVQLHRLPGHPVARCSPPARRPTPPTAAAAPTRSRSASASRSPRPTPTSTRAPTQTTGRPTDLMIQGDGIFVVQKGNEHRLHPRRRVHASTRPAPWSPRAAAWCRATRPRRRRQPHRRARSPITLDRRTPAAGADRRTR